jgi:hypothetical protein
LEVTVFLAVALALCVNDVRRMRGGGARRDLAPYLALTAVAVCAGAALIARGGSVSVIGLINDAFNIGGRT